VTLLLTLLVVAVVAGIAAVATGRITGGLDDPVSSLPSRLLPEGDVGAPDVERVRFSPALRGYRMAEVDETLDRVVAELARRDDVIARLRRRLAATESFHPDAFEASFEKAPFESAPFESAPFESDAFETDVSQAEPLEVGQPERPGQTDAGVALTKSAGPPAPQEG
jgi:DivIVA domain-containing protein